MSEEAIEATDQAEMIEDAENAVVEIAEEAAPSEVEAQAETPAEEPEKEKGIQKRINELTKQRYEEAAAKQEALERAQALEQQLAQIQQQNVQGQWQAQQPRIEDFDYDHERWAQAYQGWHSEGMRRAQEAQAEQARQMSAHQEQIKKQTEVQRKVVEAAAKYSDFNEKVNSPDVPSIAQLNPAAYEAMIDSDAMGDIAYYLASNPSEVYQFQNMPPIRAVKEIAKLEAKLSAAPAKITAAPAPPSKVSGQATVTKDPDKMTTAEWMATRNAQVHR